MFRRPGETTTLVSLLLIATGLVFTGFWWASGWAGMRSVGERLVALEDTPTDPSPAVSEFGLSEPALSEPALSEPKTQQPESSISEMLQGTVAPRPTQAEVFSDIDNVPSGLFSYGGSTTWAAIRKAVNPVLETSQPEFKLRYTAPPNGSAGSGTGIRMLLDDQLAFSQSSRPLQSGEYAEAQQRGFTLREVPVAIDGIAVAVHPELKLEGITIAQLKDIYLGNITNWKQIAGPDLAITPYSRPQDAGGTVDFFVENVLDGESLGGNVKSVFDTTSGLRDIMSNRGGIYYATATQIVAQCGIKPLPVGRDSDELVAPYQEKKIASSQCSNQQYHLNKEAIRSGEYPITRNLFVIVKQNGHDDERAGMTYADLLLSTQGQALIENAGFISIR